MRFAYGPVSPRIPGCRHAALRFCDWLATPAFVSHAGLLRRLRARAPRYRRHAACHTPRPPMPSLRLRRGTLSTRQSFRRHARRIRRHHIRDAVAATTPPSIPRFSSFAATPLQPYQRRRIALRAGFTPRRLRHRADTSSRYCQE